MPCVYIKVSIILMKTSLVQISKRKTNSQREKKKTSLVQILVGEDGLSKRKTSFHPATPNQIGCGPLIQKQNKTTTKWIYSKTKFYAKNATQK